MVCYRTVSSTSPADHDTMKLQIPIDGKECKPHLHVINYGVLRHVIRGQITGLSGLDC